MSLSRHHWTSFQASRIISGAIDGIYVPYDLRPGKQRKRRCLIWCHGAGGDYRIGPLESAVADALNTVFLMTTLGDTIAVPGWAGDAVLDKIDVVWAWAVANWGVDDEQLMLWGGSMGGVTTARYCIERPANIARAGGAIPAWDIEYARANNVGGFKSSIEAVWGVGPVPSTGRIKDRGAELTIPERTAWWIADNDVFTPIISSQKFLDDSGATGHYIGTGGHSYELGQMSAQEVIDHLSPGVYV